MAKRLPSVTKGNASDSIAQAFDPSRAAAAAAAAAVAQKNREETLKLQANNRADEAFRNAIKAPPGTYTPSQLMALSAHNPALMAEVPKAHLLATMTNPNATPEERDLAARAAGAAYSATEGGTRYVQGQENVRANIAAGPGYAMAQAHRYGADRSYQAAHERLQMDDQHWFNEPKPQYDPGTNTTQYFPQGGLVGRGPSTSVPFSPEVYDTANKPTAYSAAPGGPPLLGRSSDLTYAFTHPQADRPIYAPTPSDVQVKQITPIPARAPGSAETKLYPPPVIAAQPGVFSEPPKDEGSNVVAPQAETLNENAAIDAEQALRALYNTAAGRTDQGYLLDKNRNSVIELPKEFAAKLPDQIARVQRYMQYNKGNVTAAAQQVIGEDYGDPGPGGGFTINRGWGVAPPAITFGNKRTPLTLPATPENYPTPTPYSKAPPPKPAGPPVPPPPIAGSPATALAPPPPAAVPPASSYAPAGTSPLTINLSGNPAPPPIPRVPAVVAPPPAPAPAPAPSPAQAPAPAPAPTVARPPGTDAELIARSQAAIKAGADAATVLQRLKSWNIDTSSFAQGP